jgi:glutamine synthetase
MRTYFALPQDGKIQAEYVRIGGGFEMRCKTRTLDKKPTAVADLPIWNFDGSSTEQAPGSDSEVLLKPAAMFRDPFRPGGDNIPVLCDCYKPDPNAPLGIGEPIPTNTRHKCKATMDQVEMTDPWFGIEQEYTLFEPDRVTPYGWPKGGFLDRPQGPYYCSIGTENAYGRAVCEAHYRACLYAGVNISGINGEVMPGQWEY